MGRKVQAIDMRRLLIVLLLTAANVNSSLVEFHNDIRESILVRVIVRIAYDVHSIQPKTLHFIQCEGKRDDIVGGVVDQIGTSLSYTIEDIEHISTFDRYLRWFNIVLINGESEFSNFIKKLKDTYFDPRGLYIIVVETVLNAKERENLSRNIFKSFFALVYDNVITLFRDESGAVVFMYTFMPCDGTHACYEVVPVLYNTFDGEHFANKIWDVPKKWNDFNGCPISVALAENRPYIVFTGTEEGEMYIGGVDAKLLQMIASHLNFTIDYTISKEKGWISSNGTATGALLTVLNGNASLAIGGYVGGNEKVKQFTLSVPYLQTELVFALPVALQFGSLERHLFPLSKEIWIVYFAIHCGAFVFLSILKRFGSKLYYFIVGDHTRLPFLDMFQMFFGIGFHRTPRYTFARSLFAIWLISTFIISSTYRCQLVEILTSRSTKSIPRTISEFDELKYEIHIRPQMQSNMMRLYGNDSRIKLITEQLWYYFFELQIPSGRHRAVMDSRIIINYFNAQHYRDGVLPILPSRLKHVYMHILFKKNTYHAPAFDQVLQHFISSGLINKWTQEVMNISSAKSLRAPREPKPLHLSHFEGTFQLYGMVIAISMLMFVSEVVSLKWPMLRRIMQFYTE